MKNIKTTRQQIQELVDQFDCNHSSYTQYNPHYNETQLRVDFINQFSNTTEADYYNEIVQLVQQIINITESQTKATIPQHKNVLAKQHRLIQQKIQTIIEQLYSIGQDDVKSITEILISERDDIL